jgi:hypothetical protein
MYKVIQRNPNTWHENGENEISGHGTETADLRAAAIDAECLNLLQGEGKPFFEVESDDPADQPQGEWGEINPLAKQIAGLAIDEEEIYDALIERGETGIAARSMLGWPEDTK